MRILYIFLLLIPLALGAQNKPPLISGLKATPNWQNKTLTLQYDLSDAENDPIEITVAFSDTEGRTYALSGIATSGDVGFPVAAGKSKTIVCEIAALAAQNGKKFTVRLIADDRQPFDIAQLVGEIDSNRLRKELDFVEGIRHRGSGPAHLKAVRDSIQRLFNRLSIYSQQQAVPLNNYNGVNYIGSRPGSSVAEKVIIIDGHYDTVFNAPGADDNGSGTVGMMEAARVMSRYPSKKTLRFIGFDLEEDGLVGSARYATSGIPAGETIEGVFNFEMIGYYTEKPNTQQLPAGFNILFPDASAKVAAQDYKGNFITNVSNTASAPLASAFAAAAAQYVPALRVITLVAPGNSEIAPDLQRSDHTPFWYKNIKALMLTDGSNFRNLSYHTPGDTANGKLNFTFMSNVVKATVAAAAQLAEMQHGHWATASFETPVAAYETSGCAWKAFSPAGERALYIRAEACRSDEGFIDLYDESGRLALRANVALPENGEEKIDVGNLPAGVYILKISGKHHRQTLKLQLR